MYPLRVYQPPRGETNVVTTTGPIQYQNAYVRETQPVAAQNVTYVRETQPIPAQNVTYVRETQPIPVQQTTFVGEAQQQAKPASHVLRASAPSSGLKQDDDFLCGKMGWICCALIGLILLTLALLFGLGAFGGANASSGNGAAGAAVTGPAITAPTITGS